MAGLTVAEKEHWKDRLSKCIERRIEPITAEDPQLLDRVHEQARQLALETLGLAETQRELAAVRKEKERLGEREDELQTQILSRVRGRPCQSSGQHLRVRHRGQQSHPAPRRSSRRTTLEGQ